MASPKVMDLVELFEAEAARDRSPAASPAVGTVMGSESDLDVMAGASDALAELGCAEVTDSDDPPDARYTFETYAFSAHRTPALLDASAATAADRGLRVVIAGAVGNSADLPTMLASLVFPLPVIGVPGPGQSIGSVIGGADGRPHRRRRRREVLHCRTVGGADHRGRARRPPRPARGVPRRPGRRRRRGRPGAARTRRAGVPGGRGATGRPAGTTRAGAAVREAAGPSPTPHLSHG